MRQMWKPIYVIEIKEQNNKTILQVATTAFKEEIIKYSTNGRLKGEFMIEHIN